MKQKTNFEEAFEIQRNFTKKLFAEKYNIDIDNFTEEEKLKWSKEYILSASKELYEMLDELPKWKTHRFVSAENNLDNFAEEGIDAFKFLLNLFIVNGFTADDFWTKFLEKSVVVDIRYEQEKNLKNAVNSDRKFVVFDIDGILNDYPKNVVRYFNYLGHNYETVQDFKANDLKLYNSVKDKFRMSGEERNCKPILEHISFLAKCREQGYGIILLTARPYYKITRLFFDTIHWLSEHNIEYDFLFFAKNKEEYLINAFDKEQIHCVIDDQVDNANTLARNFTTYLLPNSEFYDSDDLSSVSKKVRIINSINEIEL